MIETITALITGSVTATAIAMAATAHLRAEIQRLSRQNELLVSTVLYRNGDVTAAAVLQAQTGDPEAMLAATAQASQATALSQGLLGLS